MQIKFNARHSSSEDTKGPRLKDMLLLAILLFLTAVPELSQGQEDDREEEEEDGGEDLNKGSGISLKFRQEIVDKHNEMRRNVKPTARNMLKMMWNETIGENARRWGDKCRLTSSPTEERTFDGVLCGQTIFQANYPYPWSVVLEFWQNKSRNFQYGVGALDPRQSIYGYTQAVWYRSYQIGCSVSYCAGSEYPLTYICQYCPTGNIAEEVNTPYKEGPPCGDCPNHCEDKLCTNPCKYMDIRPDCAHLRKIIGCKKANETGQCKATCRCKNRIK